MTIGSIARTIGRYGEYGANFVLGTGADTIGQCVKVAVENRGKSSIFRAIGKGFKEGVKDTNRVIARDGFFKSLGSAFKDLPKNMGEGWKAAGEAGKGFFGKIGGSLKSMGKVAPFLMNVMFLAMSIPSIVERTKDEGLWGGIKETAKSVAKLGVYSLGATIGAAFGPIGSIACMMGIGMLGDVILGSDYKTKKAEEAAKLEEAQQAFQQLQSQQAGKVGSTFAAVA